MATPNEPSHPRTLLVELRTQLKQFTSHSAQIVSRTDDESPYDPSLSKVEAERQRDYIYSKLYEGKFADVATQWRQAYEDACIWIALHCVNEALAASDGGPNGRPSHESRWLDEVVGALDMAIIMVGAPLHRRQILDLVFPLLEEILRSRTKLERGSDTALKRETDARSESNAKRQCRRSPSPCVDSIRSKRNTVFSSLEISHPPLSHPLPRLKCPSLATFQQRLEEDHRANDQQGALPFVITNSIDHWPARESDKWSSPAYLLGRTLGGRRLVPIEIGRSYTDDGWGQRIVPFRRFLREFAELDGDDDNDGDGDDLQRPDEGPLSEGDGTVYLAQYDLLAQVPALRNDICIPDYCYSEPPAPIKASNPLTSRDVTSSPTDSGSTSDSTPSDDPTINAWLGPANTISPLHTDPHHNILAQVVGRKYVRLYSPRQTQFLYPRSAAEQVGDRAVDMSNTSQIDLDVAMDVCEGKRFGRDACEVDSSSDDDNSGADDPDAESDPKSRRKRKDQFLREFASFPRAEYVETILEPGDCLFVPRGWWHYVRSLSASFSVSFWWD